MPREFKVPVDLWFAGIPQTQRCDGCGGSASGHIVTIDNRKREVVKCRGPYGCREYRHGIFRSLIIPAAEVKPRYAEKVEEPVLFRVDL